MGAMPIGAPGWPELAAKVASTYQWRHGISQDSRYKFVVCKSFAMRNVEAAFTGLTSQSEVG